jgi:hypothetical protein
MALSMNQRLQRAVDDEEDLGGAVVVVRWWTVGTRFQPRAVGADGAVGGVGRCRS